MGRSIYDVQRLVATVFLLGPSGLDAPCRVYAGLMSKMHRSPTEAPVVGVGISDESGKLALHLLLQSQDATLDETLVKSQFGPFEFSLSQIVTGPIVAAARRAQGGDCLGHGQPGGVTGTFGCLVKDLHRGGFLLSCNHVIADTNHGAKGIDPIWQPGAAGGGSAGDRIGVLHDFKPINLGGTVPNEIDAALARPDDLSDIQAGIRLIGQVNGSFPNPGFGIRVRKTGWKTSLTEGHLWYQKVSLIAQLPGNRVALFVNQYGIVGTTTSDFAEEGDSGAIVVDDDTRAVGLLFATASGIDLAFANPIDPVLSFFGVEVA